MEEVKKKYSQVRQFQHTKSIVEEVNKFYEILVNVYEVNPETIKISYLSENHAIMHWLE